MPLRSETDGPRSDVRLDFATLEALDNLAAAQLQLAECVERAGPSQALQLCERILPHLRAMEATWALSAGKAARGVDWSTREHANGRVWLAQTSRLAPATATGVLSDAAFLADHPRIAESRQAGELSWQHVQVLRTIVTARPWRIAAFAAVEQHFVAIARVVDPNQLRTMLRAWSEHVDDEHDPDRPDPAWEDRAVHLRQVGDGWDLRGILPRLEGALLSGVLEEIMAATRRAACPCGSGPCSCPADTTPVAARRADALAVLAEHAVKHTDCERARPAMSNGGAERARPLLLIPIDRLAPDQLPRSLLADHPAARDRQPTQDHRLVQDHRASPIGHDQTAEYTELGMPCATVGAADSERLSARELNRFLSTLGVRTARWHAGRESGTLSGDDVRFVLCDALVAGLITTAEGVPLSLGRAARTATPAQRMALIARDGGCVVPGCTMPPGWTDAHHIISWADGGASDLSNLVLACRRHHREIHKGTWTVVTSPTGPVAQRALQPHRRRILTRLRE